MASRKVARKFERQTALAHVRLSIHFQAVTRRRKLFENYLIRRLFLSSVEMAAFVSEQLNLLHSLLLLEYADGNLDEAELLLLVAGIEDDAKRRPFSFRSQLSNGRATLFG